MVTLFPLFPIFILIFLYPFLAVKEGITADFEERLERLMKSNK